MLIDEIIWQQQFVEKLATKHGVEKTEVEEVLTNRPRFRFVSKGNRSGEDVYLAMGQTDVGRYLIVFYSKTKSSGANYQRQGYDKNEAKELWKTKIKSEIRCPLRMRHQRK